MSYEIIYKKQFVRLEDKFIPLCLSGSNNCYEVGNRGRERRERDWQPIYLGRNENIALTEDTLMERVRSYCCDGEDAQHFMQNGKWVDDEGLVRFFQNGIRSAKTVEELKEKYTVNALKGYFHVFHGSSDKVEQYRPICTSEELKQFLADAEERLLKKQEKESVYICLKMDKDLHLRKTREKKERPKEFYAITVNDIYYLYRLTSCRIKYGSFSKSARRFRSRREAQTYIREKLKDRFASVRFSVTPVGKN